MPGKYSFDSILADSERIMRVRRLLLARMYRVKSSVIFEPLQLKQYNTIREFV